jgi:hypothetical protein
MGEAPGGKADGDLRFTDTRSELLHAAAVVFSRPGLAHARPMIVRP